MTRLGKVSVIIVAMVGAAVLAIAGLYWWANIPPKRPQSVSSDAVFLWAGHLGLPAAKHGTWIDCWADADNGVNRCRLTNMDGTLSYEGVFLANTGKTPLAASDLKILSEKTGQSVDLWVRVKGQLVPLVFLRSGSVLIPKDAYQEGITKLDYLRDMQGKKP
jgi:hypothetical protein